MDVIKKIKNLTTERGWSEYHLAKDQHPNFLLLCFLCIK